MQYNEAPRLRLTLTLVSLLNRSSAIAEKARRVQTMVMQNYNSKVRFVVYNQKQRYEI